MQYISLFRIHFSGGLQYRAAAFGGIATQFAWGFLLLLQFQAFYRSDPLAFTMTLPELSSYIWMQQAFLALFMTWFFDFSIFDSITGGGVAYEMARPFDLYNRWFCQNVASRLSRTVLRCIPILLVAFFLPEPFGMSLPPDIGQFALFLLSAALCLGVVVAFLMLIYISVFYTLSPLGARIVASVLADFLAGSIVPLPFFPEGFRQVAELLPFAAMQNMPLRIYSGNIAGMDALNGLGLQVFWLVVLVVLGRFFMNRALKRVIVQGG